MIYREFWKRNTFLSLVTYLRDAIIQIIPFKLPQFLRTSLYGPNIKFIFIVHPRRKEDVFIAAPFLGPLRKILPSKVCYKFVELLPASVLCTVKTNSGVNGIVVYKLTLPETMLAQKKKCLRDAYSFLRFASKISDEGTFVGLGGWWPIVTRRGQAVKHYAQKIGLRLTNGHTGTLSSMYMTIEKIALLAGALVKDLNILIIGAGKMGTNTIKAFEGKVAKITITDLNTNKLERVLNDFTRKSGSTIFKAVPATEDAIQRALAESHVSICTTSNLRRIIKPDNLPKNTLVIDDSRPEAFPRVYSEKNRIAVLEGGLMKIPGASCDYDFGFGKSDNFFGCLAETFILALDSSKDNLLKETIGDVDKSNFWAMLNFCKKESILLGDFKSSDINVDSEVIRQIIFNKKTNEKIDQKIDFPETLTKHIFHASGT